MDEYLDDSDVMLIVTAMLWQIACWANIFINIVEQIRAQLAARGEIMDWRGV